MNDELIISQASILGHMVPLCGYADDQYFINLTQSTAPELDVLTLAAAIVEPGHTVVDVGANIGFFTLAIQSFLNGKAQTFSYEPSKNNYDVLAKNIEINGIGKNARIFNYGLSDTVSKHDLYYNTEARAGAFISPNNEDFNKHSGHEVIKTKVFDDLQSVKACNLLKVDIEGHEPNFLNGATKTIKKYKPAVLIEANHWCLNAFNNTAMPQFISQVEDMFPYIYAFDTNEIVNVRDNKLKFLHKNILENQLQNLYCDFDEKRARMVVATYQRFLTQDNSIVSRLHADNMVLVNENQVLREELASLKTSRSYKMAGRINKTIRRGVN